MSASNEEELLLDRIEEIRKNNPEITNADLAKKLNIGVMKLKRVQKKIRQEKPQENALALNADASSSSSSSQTNSKKIVSQTEAEQERNTRNAGDLSKTTVLFNPSDNMPQFQGQQVHGLNLNRQTGELKKSAISGPGVFQVLPVNRHGDREFIVKLQPPAGLTLGQMPWMVYDKKRTFQCHLPRELENLATVGWSTIVREGVRTTGFGMQGYKAYCYARWEVGPGGAKMIRIFVDKLAPP